MRHTLPRRLLAFLLIAALLLPTVPSVLAKPASFFASHRDWHFDLTKEPDRPMTVEEYVALTTAYSYWSEGTAEGTTPRDRNGDLPAAWAAPYIRREAQRGTLLPAEVDYDAPATLAFAMQFTAMNKGLYHFNAVNLYHFTGTEGLSTEQILVLSTAVDYGLFPYTPGIDVSVPLLRKDLEAKYQIPNGPVQTPKAPIQRSVANQYSLAFYEDQYRYGREAAAQQLAALKQHKDDFNIVTMDTIYLRQAQLDQKEQQTGGAFARSYAAEFVWPEEQELIAFCRQNDIMILGGVLTYHDDSILKQLAASETALDQAVQELLDITREYDLDGLNLIIENRGNTYREVFCRLIAKTADALHGQGKLLMVTAGGYMHQRDEAATIYDYDAIDQAADLILLNTYDLNSARSYREGGNGVGEISNLTYSARCLRYAATVFGPERVLFGVANFGVRYNLTDHDADNITYDQVMALQKKHNATPQVTNSVIDDCHFRYTEGGKEYVVYYESDAGMDRRLALATQYGLGGMACFHLGSPHSVLFDQVGSQTNGLPFGDVSPKAWYNRGVRFAYENNLFNGMTATTFAPETTMSRAMLVTVLWRYAGQPAAGSAPFSDVPTKSWYTKAVAWASSNGIVNGVGQGRFAPEADVTRQEMATILYRYAASQGLNTAARADLSAFSDAGSVAKWGRSALQWAVAKELINGIPAQGKTYLQPNGGATRAQTATILMRFIQNITP